ncbi:hypothetical protein I6N91_06555 [Arthrobacter sp. MSA 4-2]|uniref:hypothetical protein n=1 Tax=Arthrobacter sp. MSA 4-2 TaxID=2794349 RepID=UPI0018E8AB90|nr:hypothetical protein [Arthrobacter sp. MSA 4-2]MBJ2120640.1 hypothetical protein [Arthrobacter sp. MSA 4-2]
MEDWLSDPENLTNLYRVLGGATAFAGALLAMDRDSKPAGHLVRAVRHLLARTAFHARSLLSRVFPVLRKTQNVTVSDYVGGVDLAGGGNLGVSGWPDPAPTKENIQLLRQRLDEVRSEIEELRSTLGSNVTEFRATAARLEGSVAAIRDELDRQRKESQSLDRWSLPFITTGIIVSSSPEFWAWLLPWAVSWILAVVAFLFLIGSVIWRRHGPSSG